MKRLKSPIDVQLEITALCNQKCRHCYNYWRHSDAPRPIELSSEDLRCILRKLAGAKVVQLTFTGGEPLLRPDIVTSSMAEANKLGLGFGMNSNATLVTEEIARELSSSGLQHALISVLGPPAVHNMLGGGAASFDKTMNGISHLMRHGIPVSTNMVVSKLNLDVMFETAQLLKSSGIQTFCAGPMVPSCYDNISMCLSGEEVKRCLVCLIRIEKELGLNIDILEPLPRCMFCKEEDSSFVRFFGNRACSAGVSTCVISSSGNARPCVHSDVEYGNLLREDFGEIWERMSSWADVGILPDKCRSCLAVNICEGGCRMSAKVTSGQYNGQDMYMVDPIIDHDRACVLEFHERVSQEPLTINDTFSVSSRCVVRREVDSVLICSSNRFERMSLEGFEFVELLQGKHDFTAKEIAETISCDETEVLQVFERLLISGILLKSKRKEEIKT